MKKLLPVFLVAMLLLALTSPALADWTGGHVVMGTPQGKTTWYFAEGCTRSGFNTYLCIFNPSPTPVNPTITYYFEDSSTLTRTVGIGGNSRLTIYVNEVFYGEHDVACRVTNNTPIVVERSVYFNSNGRTGGHVAMGVGQPQSTWYFAEGCTQPGFDEWLCILNPYDTPAPVTIQYMDENGTVSSEAVYVNPLTRFTRNVRDVVGDNKNVSVKITGSDVVAERPMYFNYQGKWNGGHDAVGTNSLSTTWYFGEGCTRQGFDTWLTLQNPGNTTASADITYQMATGQNQKKAYSVAPHSRKTVNVASDVGPEQDVSSKVESNIPIAVERPMYFLYRNKWDGGSDSFGATSPQTVSMFAEGCSRAGFETWLCIQNPNSKATTANITYKNTSGASTPQSIEVPANTRVTVDANLAIGPEQDFAINATSDLGLIVERPMYFDYQGKGPNLPPPPSPSPSPTPPSPSPPSYTYDFSGTGNQATALFGLTSGLTTFDLTYSTSEQYSNFIVWLKDQQGNDVELLANAMTPYSGGRVVSVPSNNNYLLDITASGPWTAHVEQPRPASAPGVPQTFQGSSDGHPGFFTLNGGAVRFDMGYRGDSNFIIWLYRSDGERVELLENEIGDRDDSIIVGVTAGIYILDIEGEEGSWSIIVSQ